MPVAQPSAGPKAGTNAVAPPSDDKRWRVVDVTMRRLGYTPSALIEALHAVQESFGCLDEPGMRYVAASLRVPLSRVYGVATFYHFFSLKPQGDHTCVVCTGTACYIKDSAGLLRAIQDRLGISPGETTPDHALSLLTARCLGMCGLAPVATLDGDVAGRLKPEDLLERLRQLAATPQEANTR